MEDEVITKEGIAHNIKIRTLRQLLFLCLYSH